MKLTETLSRLVEFDTTSGNNNQINKAYTWIRGQLKDLPVYFNTVKSRGFESLVISTKKTKNSKVILAAHIDVVPVYDRSQFKPKIVDSKIFGRGTYDMKSAIACYLKLFNELGQNLKKYNLAIVLTPDEEIGGFNGTQKVLESGYRAESVILPDIGSSWKMERSAKGVYFARLTIKGQSGHGSRPWEGKNALYTVIPIINELRKSFYDGDDIDELRKAEDTVSFGRIVGGEAANKIIEEIKLDIDIRFTPQTGKEGVIKKLKAIEAKFADAQFEEVLTAEASAIDTQNRFIQAFKQIAERHSRRSIEFVDSYGSSDARFFSALNIPVILMQSNGGGHHGPEEWCDLKDLERFYEVLKEYVEKFGHV